MAQKPDKPYHDFPLFPHASGQWAKTILGKTHYFGKWGNWQAALEKFHIERDRLYAGKRVGRVSGPVTVLYLCNSYLCAKQLLVDSGELSPVSHIAYRKICAMVVSCLGKETLVDDLTTQDFELLKAAMSKRWGLLRVGNSINHIRSVFKYGYDESLLDRPVRFGRAFRKASASTLRRLRAAAGERMFTAERVERLRVGGVDCLHGAAARVAGEKLKRVRPDLNRFLAHGKVSLGGRQMAA